MATAGKWRAFVGKALDIPPDLVMNIPRVTMIGSLQVYVENHKGLLQFTSQNLRLRTDHGELLVKGRDLVIRRVLKEELFLEGRIESVEYLGGD